MATASSAGRHEAGEWFTHGRQAARSAGSAPLIRLAAHASDRLPRRHESPESIPPARRRAEPSAARLWGRLRDARGVGEHQARRGRPWRPRRRPRRPRRRRWRAGRVWSSLVFAGRSGLALRRDNFAGTQPNFGVWAKHPSASEAAHAPPSHGRRSGSWAAGLASPGVHAGLSMSASSVLKSEEATAATAGPSPVGARS